MTSSDRDPRVLIATSDDHVRDQVVAVLGDRPLLSVGSGDAPTVLGFLGRHASLRLLILVETHADGGALNTLQAARTKVEGLAVLVLSAEPTIEHATEAIRRGAEDFVPVPFSCDLLRKEVDRILEAADLRDDVRQLRALVSNAYGFDQIISNSPRMRPVFERALAASRSDTPVLITGETGTGKELLARAIHANSGRRERLFMPVNCAALPHDLVESELFGHRRGAFSGAHRDHQGLFCASHRGTILLDEIGDLPLEAQAKLLRVLQDGEVRPVGGLESRTVDVRVVAATNHSVQELRSGVLRQDLFFRLSVLVIEVPPLRERFDDLPRLVDHFLSRYRCCGAATLCSIDPGALDLLAAYPFPGNVRELENLIAGLCVILPPERTTIQARDVKAWLRRQGAMTVLPSPDVGDLPLNLQELGARAIRTALEHAHGNKSRAAALLGVSRDTLYRKLATLPLLPVENEAVRFSDNKGIRRSH